MTLSARRIAVLLRHEVKRFLRNPAAFMLLGVLTLGAVLLATSSPGTAVGEDAAAPPPPPSIVYWEDDGLIGFLEQRVRPDLPVIFVSARKAMGRNGRIAYPPDACAIEVRGTGRNLDGAERRTVIYLHPAGKPEALWPVGSWFLSNALEFYAGRPRFLERTQPLPQAAASPLDSMSVEELLSIRVIGTLLLYSVLFFAACALLVSHASQDKERRTLHAVALTPASPMEMLLSRFAFHLLLSLLFCGLILLILAPAAARQPMLWAVLALVSLGFMAVGTLITSLAHSQATASLLSFVYVLAIGTVSFLGAQFSAFEGLQRFAFELYGMGLLFQALDPAVAGLTLGEGARQLLTPAFGYLALLALGWSVLAVTVFVRRGWR